MPLASESTSGVSGLFSWLFDPQFAGMRPLVAYASVATLVFVESGLLVGFLLPGDSVLFAVGMLAASPDSGLRIWPLAAVIFLAAFAGDQTGYLLGRRLGRPYLDAKGYGHHAKRAERFFDRYGPFAVVAARFIPWVRAFTPFVAGMAPMRYRTFVTANLVGAAVWGIGLTYLGYLAYQIPWVRDVSYVVAGVFIVGSLLLAAGNAIRRRRGAA